MCPGIEPAKMLTTFIALAEGPGVPWKPGVLKGRYPHLRTTNGPREGHDPEGYSFRVAEREMIFALELKAIRFNGDRVQTPGTKPVTVGIADRYGCSGIECRIANRRQH